MRRTQSRVPRGAVLGAIDDFARQERIAPFGEAALLGKMREKAQGHCAEPLARIVVAPARRRYHALRIARGVGEKVAQVRALPALGLLAELGPGGAIRGRSGVPRFCCLSFEPIESVALGAVAGAADVGELDTLHFGGGGR